MQLVPLPLCDENIPIEPLLLKGAPTDHVEYFSSPHLPFEHYCHVFNGASLPSVLEVYNNIVQMIYSKFPKENPENVSYNVIMTTKWMLFVPRQAEHYTLDISLNSLAFAGTILVKNDEQFELLQKDGPMKVLTTLAGDKNDSHL